jgi:hypothetical protein
MQRILNIDKLPVWRGVTQAPGCYDVMPLVIDTDATGLMFQPLNIDIEKKVISHYSDKGYAFITKPPGYSEYANRLGDQLVNFAISLINGRKGLRILEIGGGSSYVAEIICNLASPIEYVIVDPAVRDCKIAHDKITILSEYYIGQELGVFDVVLSFNCLEHIPDPMKFLQDLSNIKNTSHQPVEIGLIFPNVQDQILSCDLNTFVHEHINYFTPVSIYNMVMKLGLEVVKYESAHDEFKLILKPSGKTEGNKGMIPDIRKDIVEFAADFLENTKYSIEILMEYSNVAQKVGLHGATNGLNNIFYLSNLFDKNNFFIFDGDKSKEKMFLPVLPVPILHSSSDEYKQMDFIIVSAMTFFDEIKNSLKTQFGFSDAQIIPLCPRK